jgi:hypothetical protein
MKIVEAVIFVVLLLIYFGLVATNKPRKKK